jgi:hypothetical protein
MFRFFRQPLGEQKLLLQAAMLLALYSVLLRVFPSRTLRRFLAPRTRRDLARPANAERISRWVSVASRYIPHTTCLIRALATVHLLGLYGEVSDLRIGVAACREGQLEAHAWVECGGQIVIGKVQHIARFAVFRACPRTSP